MDLRTNLGRLKSLAEHVQKFPQDLPMLEELISQFDTFKPCLTKEELLTAIPKYSDDGNRICGYNIISATTMVKQRLGLDTLKAKELVEKELKQYKLDAYKLVVKI